MERKQKMCTDFENDILSNNEQKTVEELTDFDGVTDSDQDFLRYLQQSRFDSVLNSEVTKKLLTVNTNSRERIDLLLQDNIPQFIENGDRILRELELLGIAVSCLQTFVQNNWLGPINTTDTYEWLSSNIKEKRKDHTFRTSIETDLYMDGEEIYSRCIGIEYLYIARIILLEHRECIKSLQTWSWWLMRCLAIHQCILDDKSPTIKATCIQLMDELSKTEPLLTDDSNRDLIIQFNLEAGYLCHTFYEYKRAKEHFKTAIKVAGLTLELTGLMGKRTRFQQDSKSQLVLRVNRETDVIYNTEGPSCLPKILSLDDETVLDDISFDQGDMPYVKLSPVEQSLIIGMMEDHRRSQAHMEQITEEEVMAYINYVLSQVKCWSICISALYRRCLLQRGRRRTVERSMMQLEELVNQTKKQDPPAGERLHLFYSAGIPPVWIVQKHLADLLLDLGATGAALEVFERLELWEDAIKCYQRLGKMEKAETVIREQLQIKETPNMWCFLGDVTRDKSYYEKAWEMSKHHNARSQRCLGYIYFAEENYEKALECFEKSLKVNSLQTPVWFTYGCCATASQDNKLAAKAFKRCVMIDTDNFEAWNNLASAYIKLKEKSKACAALKEALKCNYEDWRIWENYLLVCTDCGEFSEAIHSYHRLIDIKDKWTDPEVLGVLVRVVVEDIPDCNGKPGTSFKQKLQELFGRITSKVTNNSKIWKHYGQLTNQGTDNSPEIQQKVLQYLQKSHRCVVQDVNWQVDLDRCKEVATQSAELADMYTKCSEKASTSMQGIQMLSSAKLMLKGVVTKIKQQHTDSLTEELKPEVKDVCDSLDQTLTEIIDKITHLKGS
ncbi:tetratricopeptide repeat protein 27-like [Mytilus californianus]|uniref:tetratricopeptide repeat protein 27-like n=1 Tax=Mytilus californianus TaxID=6549 RepID=UPI00224532FB|nr:tetratricopeptide repeat protein 27-like [Mytilus californianus]